VTRVCHGPARSRVGDRIVAETREYPLALLELPGHTVPSWPWFRLPAANELPAHVEDYFLLRIGELPEATQRLLLLAAAEPLRVARASF
jgi:hypothetical protein